MVEQTDSKTKRFDVSEETIRHSERLRTLYEWRKEVNGRLDRIMNILIFETVLLLLSVLGAIFAVAQLMAK